jgi:hypothetical protein
MSSLHASLRFKSLQNALLVPFVFGILGSVCARLCAHLSALVPGWQVDPVVFNMLNEDPGHVDYSSIGGLSEQIRYL